MQQFAISLASLATLIGVLSCEKQPNKVDNFADGLTINLQAPPSISIEQETRSATINSIIISDVWVFQFTPDGVMLKVQYQDGNNINQDDGKLYLAQVLTNGFKNVDSRFYVIVNGGDALFTESANYTEAQVKAKTMPYEYTDLSTSELRFLTAGPIEFKKQEVDNGKAVLVAPLERAYAKISIYYTTKTGVGSFTATGATITNIPTFMAVSTRGGGSLSTPYPQTNGSIYEGTPLTILGTTANWKANDPKSFFLPENLRGIGKSTTFSGKNKAANAPNNGKGCTILTIKGNYKYLSTHTGSIDVEYRFYLGGNLMNDYNIQRGTAYMVGINISGANSADLRVTITKGNVVVFDQVQEIERTVDFI